MVPRVSLLITTAELAGRLGEPDLRIVDIRGSNKPVSAPHPHYAAKTEAYRESHIPGAVFVDWTQDITDPAAPVHMMLAGPERFAALMERLGIGDDSPVVAYDDSGGLAPRLWWALHYYGHHQVRILDGGWAKWLAEGRPVTADPPTVRAVTFTPRVQPEWRADAAAVREAAQSSRVAVVDCRTPDEWAGKIGRGERTGRIPGARNVPSALALEGEFRTWRDAAEIRDLYARAGVTPSGPVITYCNAGVSASVGLFALKLAGFDDVRNYSGSWYEWESDPANPIERD
jgi:thiosulfate/3-mercaptopyruvate sulfurtransferase